MKPISCNKETLSKLTGLSERQIDERRRARAIPFIQLTGGNSSGRKLFIYDVKEVSAYLEEHKVKNYIKSRCFETKNIKTKNKTYTDRALVF